MDSIPSQPRRLAQDRPARRARKREPVTYWWAAAACRLSDPELFFPVSSAGPAVKQAERAKEVCGRCLVRRQCLDFALSSRQAYGIWGGLTEQERSRLLADLNPTPLAGGDGLKAIR